MRKMILSAAVFMVSFAAYAQHTQAKLPDYSFTTVVSNPVTSVKDQYRSGTCWAFSGMGFVESEIIRINGIKDSLKYPDLSVFFVVSHSYMDRADKFVRLDGNLTFSSGSECDDVMEVIRRYGIVPMKEMTGMNYGTEKPVQAELDQALKAFVQVIARNPNKKVSTAWKNACQGILDAYLGKYPRKFTVDGKEYTPLSYRDALKFNPDDYVVLTSFTHHPFYSQCALEICDNWRWNKYYNVPIDELVACVDLAVNNGFTVQWGTDVSQYGFTRNGMAVLLDKSAKVTAGSDQEKWTGKSEEGKESEPSVIEVEPTQESRQADFDSKTMTDDHGMIIYGIAKDQNGKKYYMVKNSWGVANKYKGTWYATEAFVKGQTLTVTMHKDALPKELKKKLGIK